MHSTTRTMMIKTNDTLLRLHCSRRTPVGEDNEDESMKIHVTKAFDNLEDENKKTRSVRMYTTS